MERRTYEAVVLCILVAAAGSAALVRYHRGQPRWQPYMTVPLTGAVHIARLDTPKPWLDINTARADELDALPGVSVSAAYAIVAWRARQPFTDLAELARFPGIGPKKIEALAEYLYCPPLTSAVTHTDEHHN